VPCQREGAQFAAHQAADRRRVLAQPLQHGEIAGTILGMGELRRRAFGIAVSQSSAAVVGHAGGDPAVGVPVLEPVPVQQLTKARVGRT
jgi:hypothetical protein